MSIKLSAEQIARMAWTIRSEYLASLETEVVPEDWVRLKRHVRDSFTGRIKQYLESEEEFSSAEYYNAVYGVGPMGCGWMMEKPVVQNSYRLANNLVRSFAGYYDPSK